MAVIAPFRGTYYNRNIFKKLDNVIAPPYDVVSEKQRDEYLKKEPYNILSLELPKKDLCSLDVKDKFDCAAALLNDWLSKDILVHDKGTCFYPYEIEFKIDGKIFLRKGFICLVRADDWEEKSVLPHEKTFKKVTEERFRLRCATRAQFSQIFMIYRHQKEIEKSLKSGSDSPLFEVQDKNGAVHRLYKIEDREIINNLICLFQNEKLYIADGHHRYTTAIRYRKEMEKRFKQGLEAPYNFTMAYLVDSEDSGLVVLPTHRILTIPKGIDCENIKGKLERFFDMKEIECSDSSHAESCVQAFRNSLGTGCKQGITVMFGKKRKAFLLCPKQESREQLLQEVKHKELASLDVVVLEKLVFNWALGINTGELEIGKDINFVPDSKEAVEQLKDNQILFFMSPTKVEQVLDVADAGLCMPHKSTYFYPKILTGTVLCLEKMQG